MIVIGFFIAVVLGIVIFPMLIPYLLVSYMTFNGLASRQLIYHDLKISVGGTNIFFPDLLYAACLVLACFGVLRILLSNRLRLYAPLSKIAVLMILCYFVFFIGKIISGYFDGVPVDSLVRQFALDTQLVYLFLPLIYLRQEKTLKNLLLFVVLITLLFPLAQPFLYGSSDQVSLAEGQGGTLRLGFGNANLLLMLGVFALFVWERMIWLSALPLAGMAMLAQRSAFVSLMLCFMLLSFQKKKSIKFISLVSMAGVLLVVTLYIIQATSTAPVVDKAAERFSQTFEKTGTTKARMHVIPLAFSEFVKRPLVGFSYHDIHLMKQRQHRDAFSFNMLHPHNFILSSLLRTGLIGTLILFSIIGVSLMSALRITKHEATNKQGMYLFSTILFFIVFGLMNTSFISAGYVFWILSGISLWYLNQDYYLRYKQRRMAK